MSVPAVRCKAISKASRQQCKNWAIKGGEVCRLHGGAAPAVKAKAAVRYELSSWGLGDACEDPGIVLLRLVTQSAARAQRYSMLLEEAYDAAERLKQAHDAGALEIDKGKGMVETAREDLDRIFNTGGVAALVGNTYGAAKDVGVYVTGEAIRGLADLEAKERERCATFATKAVAAGLMQKQADLAKAQGELLVKALQAILDRVSLTDEQKQAVKQELRTIGTAA